MIYSEKYISRRILRNALHDCISNCIFVFCSNTRMNIFFFLTADTHYYLTAVGLKTAAMRNMLITFHFR